MRQRSLLLWVLVLLSSIIGSVPGSLAAAGDPANFVNDLGTRALAAMRNEDTAAVQGEFRQLFRRYFDAEACARSALGPHWQMGRGEKGHAGRAHACEGGQDHGNCLTKPARQSVERPIFNVLSMYKAR
jgi:hypothetical protein